MSDRERAIREGRTLVRVRDSRTGRLATVAVCPGCWGSPVFRPLLLAELADRGLAVAHGADAATGRFGPGRGHAPGCPRAASRG